jgi:ribosomal protein S18 acetylase RimI-like enzyme
MTLELLDNIVWNSLSGPHADFSAGGSVARRYAKGFSPIVGFADAEHPDFSALDACCDAGEHFYVARWSGTAPLGWQVDADTSVHQMVWDAGLPAADDTLAAIRLEAKDIPQMEELVAIKPPGPFAARTIELGEYYGVFDGGDGDRLVAMAGERMHAGVLREVSGVCTHPDFQGRGYARRLMLKLIRIEMLRAQTPFLHVMHDNVHARGIYERMGFRDHQQMALRVVSRTL